MKIKPTYAILTSKIGMIYTILLAARRMVHFVTRPHTYGVRALLLSRDDQGSPHVLLVRHSYGPRAVWHLPGGGYRPHKETPLAALLREVYEELKIVIDGLPAACVYTHHSTAEYKQDESQVYRIDLPQMLPCTPRGEIAEYRWVPLSHVNDYHVYTSTSRALQTLQAPS